MILNNIDTKDISVVVQGAIDKTQTPLCLKSIRKYLPEAEIILSTWEGSDVSGLDYDVLVLSEDPGSDGICCYNVNGHSLCNVSRQLVSTQKGIAKCTKEYAIKMRADFFLTSNNFLKYFNSYNIREDKYSVFKNRVIVASVASRLFSPTTGFPTPYHPSDFFFFGRKCDIADYFCDTSLPRKNEMCDYPLKSPHKLPFLANNFRYAPEQFFCVEWLKRHGIDSKFADCTDWNSENIQLSNNYLFSNFIFLDYNNIGIDSKKHGAALRDAHDPNFYGLITHAVFVLEYENRFHTKISDVDMDTHIGINKRIKGISTKKKNIKKTLKIILTPVRPFVRLLKILYRYLYRFVKWC